MNRVKTKNQFEAYKNNMLIYKYTKLISFPAWCVLTERCEPTSIGEGA